MDKAPAWHEGLVPILNAHPVPSRFTRARPPIPVRARIGWASGAETVQTVATGWTSTLVLVQLSDRRCQFRGVWLPLCDVERDHGSSPDGCRSGTGRPGSPAG